MVFLALFKQSVCKWTLPLLSPHFPNVPLEMPLGFDRWAAQHIIWFGQDVFLVYHCHFHYFFVTLYALGVTRSLHKIDLKIFLSCLVFSILFFSLHDLSFFDMFVYFWPIAPAPSQLSATVTCAIAQYSNLIFIKMIQKRKSCQSTKLFGK